ncbi:TetR/AcrR family transcriptional regulator C-terminal ligand-binding domain-containing protein [Actinoplanes sp. NPDC051475]|uniref:TetR/AcrR family transcriptional regulator n=1 Tax=Actinoplanes sp. NPDC051475 TaxID=3157225 RepID=UPI0034510479
MHQAVSDLLTEFGVEQLTIAEVAARSGVHATSIYRRWGTIQALLVDVAAAQLEVSSPVPDTGSLRGDLLAYATQAAEGLRRPEGLTFLGAVLAAARSDATASVTPVLAARGAQIQIMLDRAAERGELALDYGIVLDVVLAPIYLRHLFGIGGVDGDYLVTLVDRAVTLH